MQSGDGLKVGVVSLGFIGPAHVEALRRLGIEVVFLADFNTFIPVRKKPTTPIDTFGGKMETSIEYVEQAYPL